VQWDKSDAGSLPDETILNLYFDITSDYITYYLLLVDFLYFQNSYNELTVRILSNVFLAIIIVIKYCSQPTMWLYPGV
jgi:hypothetical protein